MVICCIYTRTCYFSLLRYFDFRFLRMVLAKACYRDGIKIFIRGVYRGESSFMRKSGREGGLASFGTMLEFDGISAPCCGNTQELGILFFSFLFLPLFLKIDCGRIFRLSEGAKGTIEGGAGNQGEGTGSEAYQADGAACEL